MRRLIVAVSLLVLTGCSGGGGGPQVNPVVPVPQAGGSCEGLWVGAVTATGTKLDAAAVILANGEIHFADSAWALADGTTSPIGSSPITGNGTMYAPIGKIFQGGANSYKFTLNGNLSGETLTGGFGGGDSGTYTFTRRTGYLGAVSFSQVAGTYVSYVETMTNGIPYTMVLTQSGTFTGKDNNGGTFSGNLVAVDPAKNAFRVSITYTTNSYREYPLSGIAYFDLTGTQSKVLIQGTSTSGGFGGWFIKTGP